MAENTKIEWTDHTFNPWEGCQKVGPGCDHCYAETRNARYAGGQAINWGPGAPRRRTSAGNWNKPLAWNAYHEAFFAEHGRRQRVFCASLADVFDNAVDPQWRADLFGLIMKTPHLDWLLLTKRIGNVKPMLADLAHGNDPGLRLLDMMPLPNVWIGATIVNQEEADRDIPKLLAVPAKVRFLSMEPLLGPVDLERACDLAEEQVCKGTWKEMADPLKCAAALRRGSVALLDWVIVGGESGPGARPMHPAWARALRDQCQEAGTDFLFKQWGEWVPRSSCYHQFADGKSCADLDPGCKRWPSVRLTEAGHDGRDLAHASDGDDAYMQQVGKSMAGRLLDGRTWDEFPQT